MSCWRDRSAATRALFALLVVSWSGCGQPVEIPATDGGVMLRDSVNGKLSDSVAADREAGPDASTGPMPDSAIADSGGAVGDALGEALPADAQLDGAEAGADGQLDGPTDDGPTNDAPPVTVTGDAGAD